jgi:hypothetical protein
MHLPELVCYRTSIPCADTGNDRSPGFLKAEAPSAVFLKSQFSRPPPPPTTSNPIRSRPSSGASSLLAIRRLLDALAGEMQVLQRRPLRWKRSGRAHRASFVSHCGLIICHRRHATMEAQGRCCSATMISIMAMVTGNTTKTSSNSRANFTATCNLNATGSCTQCICVFCEINARACAIARIIHVSKCIYVCSCAQMLLKKNSLMVSLWNPALRLSRNARAYDDADGITPLRASTRFQRCFRCRTIAFSPQRICAGCQQQQQQQRRRRRQKRTTHIVMSGPYRVT